jgi:hypothetical protein
MDPAEAKQLIRFALAQLSADNGHHEFETVCRHFVRETICANLLPATGPAAGGGDQGRDFESFRGESDGRKLVFACTLTVEDRLPGKIKSDVRKIMAGEQVDMIYALCGSNLRVDKRHALIDWARKEYQVPLEIIDGNALAEALAERRLRWICQKYLSVPGKSLVTGLPRKARDLIGRDDGLACARRMLAIPGDSRPLIVVTGPPGVGKTEFAIALAESVVDLFPDGQYLVEVPSAGGDDLVGMLSDVLDGGARPDETRQQQLIRLRSVLAGQRVLLVVDNVTAEQALLEVLRIDDGFAVVCTSRSRLTGLDVEHADVIELEPLTQDDAANLACSKAARLTIEESQLLADLCGGLPLAVLIAAAQIKRRPKLSVREYLARIADPDYGIAELAAGQRSMAAVIEYSYRCLTTDQTQLIQALGLLPNTTVTLDVIAGAIAGADRDMDSGNIRRATHLLDDLFELNLVEQLDSVAYRLHDVLYRFARMKAAEATREWRNQVMSNSCVVYGVRLRYAAVAIGFPAPETTARAESTEAALAMLEATRIGALAMAESACKAQLWDHAFMLATMAAEVLRHLGHWHDAKHASQVIYEAGIGTATNRGSPAPCMP